MTLPLSNVLEIPQKATYEIQDKTYVFVVDKNGVAKSREITIAQELEDIYIIASGLQENEQFLVEGAQKVKDNQKVQVKMQSPESVMKSLKVKAN
jgi:membrane fusion protein (multidrug efflux system)